LAAAVAIEAQVYLRPELKGWNVMNASQQPHPNSKLVIP
jgi:hypothetical protein